MRRIADDKEAISRRGFLKLSFAAMSGAALFLLLGCLGGGDDDDDDDDDDD